MLAAAAHHVGLYYILVLRVTEKALNKLRTVEAGNGLEVWRVFQHEWEPRVRGRFGGLLQQLISARFEGDVIAALDRWETAVKKYVDQSGEVMSDNLKCAVVMKGNTDATLQSHLQLNSSRLTEFSLMKKEMQRMIMHST